MGTDIHVYVETRENDGKWQIVPVYTVYKYVDDKTPHIASPYNGRDYDLFEWLKDSFGVRGIPSDACDYVTNEYDDEYFDPSWATLASLKSQYNKIPKKIIVDYDEENNKPIKGKNELRLRVKSFIRSIEYFVDIYGYYNEDEVRIIFWYDC